MNLILMFVVFFMGLIAAGYAGSLAGSLIAVAVSFIKGRAKLVAPMLGATLAMGIFPLICGLLGWWLSGNSEKMWLSFRNGMFAGIALGAIWAPIQATIMLKTAKE